MKCQELFKKISNKKFRHNKIRDRNMNNLLDNFGTNCFSEKN